MNNNRLKQKSILIIAHSYKPLLNPRAFRWTAIAEQCIKDGYTVDIITSWQPGMPREEIIYGVKVFRIGDSIVEKLRNRFNYSSKKTIIDTQQINNTTSYSIKKIIKSVLHFVHDITWKKLYWPDYAFLWKKSAVESALYLLNIEKYDTMITVSDPFTSHLVGQEVKKHYPDLHWLVDIGDPFCFRHDTPTNNHNLYRSLNYKTEKNIFAEADFISVTTETTKNKYSELFPESSDKIVVIPPLYQSDSNTSYTTVAQNNNDTIKILFIGTLYKKIRNPQYLLELFTEIQRKNKIKHFELHFYGSLNDCKEIFEPYSQKLDSTIFLHGLVDRATVSKAMSDADILVNIGNNNPYQLPSKVVEYAATGKKIVNLIQINNDTSKQFFTSYQLCLNLLQTNKAPTINDIKIFSDFVLGTYPLLTSSFIQKFIETYQTASITDAYQKLLQPNKTIKDRPIFSVMTPVYNGEDFIKRCYFMLCNQTFTDWEWIVVNDGSTDKTKEIIDSFDDNRIKLISYNNNKGRGYARTKALKEARGMWLVVWDVDDIYFPDRLDKLNQARLDGYDFCCSYVMLIDNDLNTEQIRGFYYDDTKTTKIFVHPTLGCKLELAQKIGYHVALPAGEDAALILTLARKYNGQWIKDILVLYQEVREVNIHKTLSSNYGQLASMKILYEKNILDITKKQYYKMIIKWNIKIFILQLFRLVPSLYLKTVALRKTGEKDTNWKLSNERKIFIKEIQDRNKNKNWTVQKEKINL